MIYTSEEIEIIEQAKSEDGNVWNSSLLDSIKRRIKNHYRTVNSEQCCYCKRDFQDEFNMVIDIEHILPKSLFAEYMFEVDNLNISCKRCNMNIKKDRIDFIVDIGTIKIDYKISSQYHFIHPNFDNYYDHIDYEAVIRNNKKLIKYITKSNKGIHTYNYFHLDKIEIDTLSEAQGIKIDETEINTNIPEQIKSTFEDLIQKI